MLLKLLIIYAIIVFTMFCLTVSLDPDELIKTPAEMYDRTKFNMPTCIILYCLWVVFNPLSLFLCFIWYLMHVGRKD